MKLCINCQYHRKVNPVAFDECARYAVRRMDLVTGRTFEDGLKRASTERESYFGCGERGRYFVMKVAP